MLEKFHLGHFIKEKHIAKAIELLQYQFEQKSPLYNNLDFSLYKQEDISRINAADFYKDYVENDTLYYFENLFYSLKYFSIQKAYKIREFHYLSLQMMIVYYALGMYINELMSDVLETEKQMYNGKSIKIYYGGKLSYEAPKNSNIFYYQDYKSFLVEKEKATTPINGKKIFAVSLDIKSFFYTIDHKILLNIIEKDSSAISRKRYNYDEDTKKSIAFLLELLQKGQLGLPVSNQNLVSGFLSSIYLSRLDHNIFNKYINKGNSEFCYLRYVDDFYLILKADMDEDESILRNKIYDIENELALFLIKELELSVSTEKCKRFKIVDEESQLDFLKASNLDSPFDSDFDYEVELPNTILRIDTEGLSAPEIFNKCIDLIAILKAQSSRLEQLSMDTKDAAFLNYILLLSPCLHYSRSPAAEEYIDSLHIFDDISAMDFLLIKPKVMLHLATLHKKYREKLVSFLTHSLSTPYSIVPKLTLLDKYIHQMNFLISESKGEERILLERELQENTSTFVRLLEELKSQLPQIEYLDLVDSYLRNRKLQQKFEGIYQVSFLNNPKSIPLVQQIKLRRISELSGNYSVSLNHLINEFQNLFGLIYFDSVNKTSLEITNEMSNRNYNSSHIQLIKDFFGRRNENSVSHPNMPEIGIWSVQEKEYFQDYKKPVHEVISRAYNDVVTSNNVQ